MVSIAWHLLETMSTLIGGLPWSSTPTRDTAQALFYLFAALTTGHGRPDGRYPGNKRHDRFPVTCR
jgi:hypothetical protein